jgi:hypothetical protein
LHHCWKAPFPSQTMSQSGQKNMWPGLSVKLTGHLQYGFECNAEGSTSSSVRRQCLRPRWLSWLPPKSAPLLVRAALGGRPHGSSSHDRSTFHFPFVLSCFPAHLVYIPSSLYVYIILCSPHVCVCNCSLRLLCDASGCFFPGIVLNPWYCIVVHYFVWPVRYSLLLLTGVLWRCCVRLICFCQLKCACSLISALLHLTLVDQLRTQSDNGTLFLIYCFWPEPIGAWHPIPWIVYYFSPESKGPGQNTCTI